ncbi:MAG: phosphoribosyltransferase [Candidatus Thermoplasmatota archaeon]|nr:phosphoribosyltransferase [Candidatus Thermoplasmatota archaeon]MCL6090346.1 phosphoribosyltransferase [Candidatus Thermoplasmatota archaeon]
MDFRARIVTWTDVEKWCSSIRDQVIDSFVPDMIIGLSRGGLVPARILSDTLWIKDLISIKTEHWGITATKSGKAILRDPGKLNLNGRKVLIVDDITDTGQSMKLAYDFVKSQEPAEVKTATMLHITRSSFIPDFYGELVDQKNWAWFIFPWNVYEDLDNLLSKVLNGRASLEELKTLLLKNFDLKIEDTLLETVINDFVKAGRIISNSGVYSREKIAASQ